MRKVNQVINKPFQVGFTVLEWSKLLMYRSYAQLKDFYGDRMHLLYTDTDSFLLQFYTHDLYKDVQNPKLRDMFDFSEIPIGHPSGLSCPNDPFGGRVGFFKDETKGDPIIEFIGLKPKMYSFKVCSAVQPGLNTPPTKIYDKQVGKGICRTELKKHTFTMYMDMYNKQHIAHKVDNRRIGSKLHKVNYSDML